MIDVEQRNTQGNIQLNQQEANHKICEIGQLRRAKMHISCLVDDMDKKNALTPSLRKLLEASLILQTTSTKILAAYLHRSPATIRAEFQRILSILGNYGGHSSLHANENDEDCPYSQASNQ